MLDSSAITRGKRLPSTDIKGNFILENVIQKERLTQMCPQPKEKFAILPFIPISRYLANCLFKNNLSCLYGWHISCIFAL